MLEAQMFCLSDRKGPRLPACCAWRVSGYMQPMLGTLASWWCGELRSSSNPPLSSTPSIFHTSLGPRRKATKPQMMRRYAQDSPDYLPEVAWLRRRPLHDILDGACWPRSWVGVWSLLCPSLVDICLSESVSGLTCPLMNESFPVDTCPGMHAMSSCCQ